MLRINQLSIVFGTRTLYSGVTVLANDAERIALVGENGSGKTTLFNAILGTVPLEDGTIDAPRRERIAYVEQTIDASDTAALDYVLDGHTPYVNARENLHKLRSSASDPMVLAQAESTLAELNEGAIRAQAQSIMAGLGFQAEDETKAVKTFSGGWRNRLSLARALMCPSELLLLDEPTNHLDMDSLIWLESWLKKIRATVIIISHDREFLDRATVNIWAIEDGTLTRWSGNYSSYEAQRIEKLRLQDAAHKAYERKASHLRSYIERFRYKATKARQAQSRIKMLDKLEAIEPVRARRHWRFEFLSPEKIPDHLVDIENVNLAYGEKRVLSQVNLVIRREERIGVLGVNGAGKSTLIKAICRELSPVAGEVRLGSGTTIGYFAQHQLEQLDATLTALETFRHKSPLTREQELRDYLGKFKFSADAIDKPISVMSGGEKARLALALIAWDKPNLLVLDEPTNHLDMETREALTMALSTFGGSLILVSHDRHLLRTACERLILVHEGKVSEYEGDLDDYAKLVLEHRKLMNETVKTERKDEATTQNRKEIRRLEAQERARIAALKKPLLKKAATLEKNLAEKQEMLQALDRQIADADWYQNSDPDLVANTLRSRGELAAKIETLELEWLEISEQIEAIQ